MPLQFDIAEFARGVFLDAVAQAYELLFALGLGSSALSNTRSGTSVPEMIRLSQATIIRLLRFLTTIATVPASSTTWSVQPLSTALPPPAISAAIFDKGWLYQY